MPRKLSRHQDHSFKRCNISVLDNHIITTYKIYIHCGSKKRANLADYNYDPVQSILIIFSKLFDNDHKSCPVVKFPTLPHICCHYTL